MADQGVSNGDQNVLDVTLSYISADNQSRAEPALPPVISSYYDDGGSWFFSSHDIPILIGAAAGLLLLALACSSRQLRLIPDSCRCHRTDHNILGGSTHMALLSVRSSAREKQLQ